MFEVQNIMVRRRSCDEGGEMTLSFVMCVPVDSTDRGYQSLVAEKQRSTQTGRSKEVASTILQGNKGWTDFTKVYILRK